MKINILGIKENHPSRHIITVNNTDNYAFISNELTIKSNFYC